MHTYSLSLKMYTLTAFLATSLFACSEKSTADKSTADKPTADKSTADKSTADKSTADKSTADKSTAESTKTANMTVTLTTIPNGAVIPADHAFCVEDGKGKGTFGPNKSPEIKWEGAPKGTQSYALIAVDPKVPSKADNVNKEGKSVSKDLPRVNFYHWVLADIPATLTHISASAEGEAVVPKGKSATQTPHGIRGLNNYGDWFASNKDMSGQYGGYDGPCPPWNDELVHEYHFEVYALDVATLNLKAGFKAPELVAEMKGHILAKGVSIGLYKLNTKVSY